MIKCEVLSSILSFFHEFNRFSSNLAQILNDIHHMPLKLL